MNALEPNDFIRHIEADLKPWVAANKGYLSIAGDPGQLLESLTDAPQSFRVTMLWGGDADQSGQEEAGIVTNTFEFWIMRARGLKMKPGDDLVRGDKPFLSLVSDLRMRLRSLAFFPGEEICQDRMLYKSAKPFPNPEMAFELPTVGYALSFELIAALPSCELRG
jgi:hypothetical protein